MILEAAVFNWIDRRFQLRRRSVQSVEHGAKPDLFGARPLRQVEAVKGRERCLRRAGGRDEADQQFPGFAADRGDSGGVLVIECGAQGRCASAVDAVTLDDRRHQGRHRDVDREVRHADRGERLAGNRDDLDIGGGADGADQFGADFADLPLGPDFRSRHPQHLARITQPQRPRCGAKPGRRDARDLRRHIGANADHPMRHRVHQPESRRRHRRAGAGEQRLFEFDEWRLDPAIPVRGERGDQP